MFYRPNIGYSGNKGIIHIDFDLQESKFFSEMFMFSDGNTPAILIKLEHNELFSKFSEFLMKRASIHNSNNIIKQLVMADDSSDVFEKLKRAQDQLEDCFWVNIGFFSNMAKAYKGLMDKKTHKAVGKTLDLIYEVMTRKDNPLRIEDMSSN